MQIRDHPPESTGIWDSANHDILPANIPVESKSAAAPAPRPRRRRWRVIAGGIVIALVFVGFGIFLGLRFGVPIIVARGGAVHTLTNVFGDPRVNALVIGEPPIPKAAVTYLEDQAKGDAQGMWNLYSPQAQQLLTQAGAGESQLAQSLRAHPFPPIKQITFTGGTVLSDGREATVFVVTADVNGALEQAPYYFTVNANGQIDEAH